MSIMLLVLFDRTNLPCEFHWLIMSTTLLVLFDKTNLAYEFLHCIGNPIIRNLDNVCLHYMLYATYIWKKIEMTWHDRGIKIFINGMDKQTSKWLNY